MTTVAALALIGLGAAGCGDDASSEEPAAAEGGQQKTLSVLASPHANVAPLYIALEKGYLKAEGLDVKVEPPASPAAAFPALATGKVDMMYASIQSGATAVANGQKLKMIAQSSVGSPDTVGIVSNDDAIKTGADLVGKKIAGVIIKGGTCDLGAKAVLSQEGVDISKLQWVELPPASAGPAMERGDIDAVCAVEPAITQLKQQTGAHLVVDSLTGPFEKMPADGYFVREQFAAQNPETIEAFERAIAKAVEDAKADEAALRKTIAGYSKMPSAVVDAMTLPTYVTGADPAQVQRVLDSMADAGVLPKPLTAEQLVAE